MWAIHYRDSYLREKLRGHLSSRRPLSFAANGRNVHGTACGSRQRGSFAATAG